MAKTAFIQAQWIMRCAARILEIRNDLLATEAQRMAWNAYEQCNGAVHPVEAAEGATEWDGPTPPPPSAGGSTP